MTLKKLVLAITTVLAVIAVVLTAIFPSSMVMAILLVLTAMGRPGEELRPWLTRAWIAVTVLVLLAARVVTYNLAIGQPRDLGGRLVLFAQIAFVAYLAIQVTRATLRRSAKPQV